MAARKMHPCAVCREAFVKVRGCRCPDCRWGKDNEAVVDTETRYADDVHAQNITQMSRLRGGATLEVIGEAMNMTREAVRQIEERAFRKLVLRLRMVGIDASDIRHILATRHTVDVPPPSDNGYVSTRDIGETKVRRRREAYEAEVGAGPYSEHGMRVESAIEAAEIAAVRAYFAAEKTEVGACLGSLVSPE